MPEDPSFSPEQDRMLESRTLSDAGLIKDGAEYENGVLDPTLEQKAEIRKEYIRSKINIPKRRTIIQGHGRPETVSEVSQIGEQTGRLFDNREEIAGFVEKPLLAAAQILYDRNVQTTASTANLAQGGESGIASLCIDYETLSGENKEIAQQLGLRRDKDSVYIEIPINRQSKVEEISAQAVVIAERFVPQEPKWVPCYSLEEVKAIHGIRPEESEWVPEDFPQLYFDRESGLFYPSEGLFMKVRDWGNRAKEK